MQLDEHVHPGALPEAGEWVGRHFGSTHLHVNADIVRPTVVVSVKLDGQAAACALLGNGAQWQVRGEVEADAVSGGAVADVGLEPGDEAIHRGAGIEVPGNDKPSDLAHEVGGQQHVPAVDRKSVV